MVAGLWEFGDVARDVPYPSKQARTFEFVSAGVAVEIGGGLPGAEFLRFVSSGTPSGPAAFSHALYPSSVVLDPNTSTRDGARLVAFVKSYALGLSHVSEEATL